MPNYKGHLTGGLIIALICVYIATLWMPLSIGLILQLLLCALFGSLFPDIDTKSQGQLLSYRILAVVLVVLIMQQRMAVALACSVVGIVPLVVHHRGLFHRVWFITALCVSVVLYAWLYIPFSAATVALHTFFFFIGALSHIWLDVGLKRMFYR